MKNIAKLRVDSIDYAGWKSVSITRGIESACSSFQFASTSHNPATNRDFNIRVASECEITIDDQVVLTGFVDEINPSHDKSGHEIPVSGRSKTCDIVDCSAINKPAQWTRQKIEKIAAEMCSYYGVRVRRVVDTGDVIDKHVIEPGETVFNSLERLCRPRGLLLTDDAAGNLVITRAGAARAHDALTLGDNLLSCGGKFSAVGRFSEYRCYGQRRGSGSDRGALVSQSKGTATDDGILRKRVLVVLAEEQADNKRCSDRATWEAATRAGKATQIECTVYGWAQSNGVLWTPNEIAHVTDPVIGVDDDLLITDVAYGQSNEGTITRLTLAPLAGFQMLSPLKTRRSAKPTGYWAELEGGKPTPRDAMQQQNKAEDDAVFADNEEDA